MATLLAPKKIERQGTGVVNVVATLASELPNYDTFMPSKSGLSLLLFKDDQMVTLVFSKALNSAIKAKQVTMEQLPLCNIVLGANAAGEERYYLSLPADARGMESAATLLAASSKATPIRIPLGVTLTAAQQSVI